MNITCPICKKIISILYLARHFNIHINLSEIEKVKLYQSLIRKESRYYIKNLSDEFIDYIRHGWLI